MSDKISRATLSITSPSTLATRAILQFLIPGCAGIRKSGESGPLSGQQLAGVSVCVSVCVSVRARVSAYVPGGWGGEGTEQGSRGGPGRRGGQEPQREARPPRQGQAGQEAEQEDGGSARRRGDVAARRASPTAGSGSPARFQRGCRLLCSLQDKCDWNNVTVRSKHRI